MKRVQEPGATTHLSSPLPSAPHVPVRRPVLIAMFGPNPGTVYPIDGEVVVGRGEEASITIHDDRVSRRHTRIVALGPDLVQVEDLGSKNGTWVNGRRITCAELRSGDTVQVGNEVVFHFAFRDPLEQRMFERQKLAAIGRLVGGVADEFEGLLSVVVGNLDRLRRALEADGSARPAHLDALDAALGAAESAADMTHQLRGLAHSAVPSDAPVDLSALVGGLARLLGRLLGREVRLELAVEPGLHVRGQAPDLRQALLSLCLDARDAMAGGGTLTLGVRRLDLDDPRRARGGLPRGSFVELRVEDTGAGMDAEARKHLFEPFFAGAGVGMAAVHAVVTGHGGHVDVESASGRGTVVTLLLPCVEAPAVAGGG